MCDYKMSKQIGYDIIKTQCKRKAKWELIWESASGIHSEKYCTQHKKIQLADVNRWDILLELNAL